MWILYAILIAAAITALVTIYISVVELWRRFDYVDFVSLVLALVQMVLVSFIALLLHQGSY